MCVILSYKDYCYLTTVEGEEMQGWMQLTQSMFCWEQQVFMWLKYEFREIIFRPITSSETHPRKSIARVDLLLSQNCVCVLVFLKEIKGLEGYEGRPKWRKPSDTEDEQHVPLFIDVDIVPFFRSSNPVVSGKFQWEFLLLCFCDSSN